MYILGFIILFLVIGFFLGVLIEEEAVAFGIIFVLTVIWAFIFGPWAVATFVELFVGYAIGSKLTNSNGIGNSSGGISNLVSDWLPEGEEKESSTDRFINTVFDWEGWEYNAFTRLIKNLLLLTIIALGLAFFYFMLSPWFQHI